MPRRNLIIFWIVVSLLASISIYIATRSFGAGVSEDGAKYLSAAQSLLDGRGLYMYNAEPMTQWPPGYPAVLAFIHMLTGVDVFYAGGWLNVFLFGLIVFLSAVLFWRAFGEGSVLTWIGPLFVATSVALIAPSVNISSDPLFMLLSLLFLFSAEAYLRKPTVRSFIWLAVLAAMSCMVRYVGLGLVAAGSLVMLAAPGVNVWGRLRRAVVFGLLSALPMMAWGFLRNYALTGTYFGPRQWASVWLNLGLVVDKVVAWFVPRLVLEYAPPLAIFAAAIVGLWVLSTRASRAAFVQAVLSPAVWPSLAFVVGYTVILARASSFFEFSVEGFDRVHVIMLPSLLVLAGIALIQLPSRLYLKLPARVTRAATIMALCGLLAFTGYRAQKYLRAVEADADTVYNFANTPALQQSGLVRFLHETPALQQEVLFSNNEAALWFYLRKDIYRMPRVWQDTGWTTGQVGHVVWFYGRLDYKHDLVEPQVYLDTGELQLIFEDEVGAVYRLSVSGP